MSKILLAEDDKTVQATLKNFLETAGHSVVSCFDGQEALDILESNSDIDVVVTDIVMPGLDGRKLVKNLRASKKFAHMPVIMISGIVSLKEIVTLLKGGVTRFIPKPVSSKDLLEAVDACLD